MEGSLAVSSATVWWILAGVLVAVELATGSFYLLMLSLGAVAAALAAHAGLGLPVQLLVAALLGGGAVVAWHLKRGGAHDVGDRLARRDVSLDVGETVYVDRWQPDGSTQVFFRGSTWRAVQHDAAQVPRPGRHLIVALEGNRLMLRPA
jgi:membrane protein implicated in regulation of membrane protease activity